MGYTPHLPTHAGFYDGLHFHRVISEFMAQGGCPRSKDPKAADAGEGAPPPASTFEILGCIFVIYRIFWILKLENIANIAGVVSN